MSSDVADLLKIIEKAQAQGLCPNRIWRAGSRFSGWRARLLKPLQSFCDSLPENVLSHEDHSACTLDFCEFSSRNFTAVSQYHERYSYQAGDQTIVAQQHGSSKVCFPIEGLFNEALLVKAVESGKLTAWNLDGTATLEHPLPFMAISHVWSDGTGAGAWSSRQVNFCLYKYFRDIAERFSCWGIWWDTLCIPQDRVARAKSLSFMDLNYAYARITLVHDRFLRNLIFEGPDAACFAIVMSAWFTRGWTALELARSRKVKVVFKDSIKDLDYDILDRVEKHNIAAGTLRNLRNAHVSGVDDLLNTLGSRY
ncbi:hypothetical protein M406DRAFT_232427, partial [Cryphonectria parasitica EP155]